MSVFTLQVLLGVKVCFHCHKEGDMSARDVYLKDAHGLHLCYEHATEWCQERGLLYHIHLIESYRRMDSSTSKMNSWLGNLMREIAGDQLGCTVVDLLRETAYTSGIYDPTRLKRAAARALHRGWIVRDGDTIRPGRLNPSSAPREDGVDLEQLELAGV